MDLTAVGVPVLTGPAQGWNFWPLIGIPVALFIAFRWLGLPRRVWVALTAILVGLLIADAVAVWGVLPVAGGTTLVVAGSSMVNRLRRRHPPTV
jgi:hypothetical protein